MITKNDLNKVTFITTPNPLYGTIKVEVQCEYGLKKYYIHVDVTKDRIQSESLEKCQDELIDEIVHQINKGQNA